VKVKENEAGGTTVIVERGDDLKEVPRSHQGLITASLREAFADPTEHFSRMAKRCPFAQMARWLRALVEENQWELRLNQGVPEEWTLAGFRWSSQQVRGATVDLPFGVDLSALPSELKEYFKLVDEVNWNGFGCAGEMKGAGEHTPLTAFQFDYRGAKVDLAASFVLGTSNGDMLIYTRDGRGGWLCLETHNIHLWGPSPTRSTGFTPNFLPTAVPRTTTSGRRHRPEHSRRWRLPPARQESLPSLPPNFAPFSCLGAVSAPRPLRPRNRGV